MTIMNLRCLFGIAMALSAAPSLTAAGLSSVGDEKASLLTMPFDIKSYGDGYSRIDRDGDGRVDYIAKTEKNGAKSFEAMDFNNDELLDDFYVYEKGMLMRREIDSNFDGKIDLWMYLYEGTYVEAYERDTDFNGTIDIVKRFGKQTASIKP